MKVINCNYPKGYKKTNLSFTNMKFADEYVNSIRNEFFSNKTKIDNYNLSKRKQKIMKLSEPKKFILTQKGNKFLLWERMN